MATYREIVYMVLDEIKQTTDDSFFNEDHVMFLVKNYRTYLLKLEIEKKKKEGYYDEETEISDEFFQELCLDLEPVPAIEGDPCLGGLYLRSTKKIPSISSLSSPRIYAEDFYSCEITYVPMKRMKYVGNNKWLKNIIYCSISPDNYLYLKSSNPQFLYLEKIRISAVFDDDFEAAELMCETCDGTSCDPMDSSFPMSRAFIPQLIQLIVQELTQAEYAKLQDKANNASDDVPELYNASTAARAKSARNTTSAS